MMQACPLSLPKAMVKLKQESQDEYFKRWGYRRVEQWDKKLKKRVEDWEEVDVYLRRVTALVHFYAAFVQSDQQKVHGMEHGWSYLARYIAWQPCDPSGTLLIINIIIWGPKFFSLQSTL